MAGKGGSFVAQHEGRLVAAVVLLATALYVSALWNQFTLDDAYCIKANLSVTGPLSWSRLTTRDFWGYPFGEMSGPGTWRPLATFLFWAEWHVAGGSPWAFHLGGLLLHAANLYLGWVFLRRFVGDTLSATGRVAVIAAFATLAVHVDVIPSATGQAEQVAMLGSLLALHTALGTSRISAICFPPLMFLALMTKESTLPVAVLAALLVVKSQWSHATKALRSRAVFVASSSLVMLVAAVLVRKARQPFSLSTQQLFLDNPLAGKSLSVRIQGSLEVITRYLEHSVAPFDLCPDYSYATFWPTPGSSPRQLVGLLGLIAVILVLIRGSWKATPVKSVMADTVLGLGASYIVASHFLLPASALVADRLFFLPSYWLLILTALAIQQILVGQTRIVHAAIAAVVSMSILFQGSIAAIAATFWKDDLRLSTQVVAACPDNLKMRMYRAGAMEKYRVPQEAAWSLLIAGAIQSQYPNPLPKNAFPASWESLPLDDRIARLKKRVGGLDGLRDVVSRARNLGEKYKLEGSLKALDVFEQHSLFRDR